MAGRKNLDIPSGASEDWLDGYIDGQCLEIEDLDARVAQA